MAGFEVVVEAREGSTARRVKFTVGSDQESVWKYGTTAEEVARSVAEDYCDSGDAIVRRLGGGERFVLGRS